MLRPHHSAAVCAVGAPLAPAHAARFLAATSAPPALAGLALGSDEAPQDGATLLLQVSALEAAPSDGISASTTMSDTHLVHMGRRYSRTPPAPTVPRARPTAHG